MQTNAGRLEDDGSCCGIAVCDDEMDSDEQTDESFCSDTEESVHSVEAPPYSPITMDGTDSDEDLDIDILLPVANEPCKNC